MKASDLKPASHFANKLGVKMLAYGPPGAGKTPIFSTAPRPVLVFTEPGMRSMSKSSVPTWEATTLPKFEEFMNWLFGSAEAKNYDTVGIDSVSQLAEMYTTHFVKKEKNGMKAYGEMARSVMEVLNPLFYMPNKHMYLICKLAKLEVNGAKELRPYFPGQDLNIKIPHMFDEIAYIDKAMIPGVGTVTAVRTTATVDILARDRSGNLAELEPPDLSAIFAKCMQ